MWKTDDPTICSDDKSIITLQEWEVNEETGKVDPPLFFLESERGDGKVFCFAEEDMEWFHNAMEGDRDLTNPYTGKKLTITEVKNVLKYYMDLHFVKQGREISNLPHDEMIREQRILLQELNDARAKLDRDDSDEYEEEFYPHRTAEEDEQLRIAQTELRRVSDENSRIINRRARNENLMRPTSPGIILDNEEMRRQQRQQLEELNEWRRNREIVERLG